MPEAGDLASAVATLRPNMQWFLVNGALAALVFWAYSDKPWAQWPWPVQGVVISWLVITWIIGGVILFTGLTSLAWAWWEAWNTKPPTAPKPPSLPAPGVPGHPTPAVTPTSVTPAANAKP